MKTKIGQIVTALVELEAKECHRTLFEYSNGTINVKITHIETEKVVYEKTINVATEGKELKKICRHINDMQYCIWKVPYQCYVREFIKGVKSGEWKKTKSVIEHGINATASKQIDGSGCFIDDDENGLQYYVNYKQIIETGK